MVSVSQEVHKIHVLYIYIYISHMCMCVLFVTCLKKLVMVSVAGLKPVRLHDSSPLVVLSRERLPMMLEFLRSDHEPFLSAHRHKRKYLKTKQFKIFIDSVFFRGTTISR